MREIMAELRATTTWLVADRALQLIVLGVIAAGFLLALVLDADASLVTGVVVVGLVTALVERAHWRNRSRC